MAVYTATSNYASRINDKRQSKIDSRQRRGVHFSPATSPSVSRVPTCAMGLKMKLPCSPSTAPSCRPLWLSWEASCMTDTRGTSLGRAAHRLVSQLFISPCPSLGTSLQPLVGATVGAIVTRKTEESKGSSLGRDILEVLPHTLEPVRKREKIRCHESCQRQRQQQQQHPNCASPRHTRKGAATHDTQHTQK